MACFKECAEQASIQVDLDGWMEKWLQRAGVNTLTSEVKEVNGKWSLTIRQDVPKVEGTPPILREQMIDIAVFKLANVEGVSEDKWTEEGVMELTKKFEIV